MELNYLSIDIGGTNIKTALIDRSGSIFETNCFATPNNLTQLFEALSSEIDKYRSLIRGIAISCPGKVNPQSGRISFGGALPFLDGISLKEELGQKYSLPVSVVNDGKAAALAELWLGNLQQVQYGAAITLGTGLGGGIIINGELIQGAHFQAGELSFMIKDEKEINSEVLYGFSGSAVKLIKTVSKSLGLKENKDGKSVFKEIINRNSSVYPLFEQFCREIAYVIINLQAIIDIEKIVIGGGVSSQPILISEIKSQYSDIRERVPLLNQSISQVTIEACKYRNEANLLGALYQLLIDTVETKHFRRIEKSEEVKLERISR